MRRVKVTFQPWGQSALVPAGETILQAASRAGLAIEAPCAGKGTCGRCRVRAGEGLYPPSASEIGLLSQRALASGIRLACLARIASDVDIEVLGLRGERAVARRKAGLVSRVGVAPSPNIRKIWFDASELSSEKSQSIFEDLRSLLSRRGHSVRTSELSAIQKLASATSDELLTAVLAGERLIALESGDTTADNYGVAIDLGTSTVVGYLLDLSTGHQLAAWGTANPQRAHGDDVVSRIQYAIESGLGLEQLHNEAVQVTNSVVAKVAEEAQVKRDCIYEVVLVGNNCMVHLLLGISPVSLAVAPYRSATTESVETSARSIGIEINRQGLLYVLPSIAGFVGSDTVGVILATGLHRSANLKLAIDLGTNGELVLGSRKRLICCSTAAGPAFEGGRIRHGMSADRGAIERVIWDNNEARVVVIGNIKARGICGSGLVDSLGGMVKSGIVGLSGRLEKGVRGAGGENLFVLVDGNGSEWGEPIAITQGDIRELQLAKGAIRAGIEILKKEMDVADEDVSELLLAGAFGSYVSKESAADIGLLPDVPLDRVRAVGNAAGAGAKLVLMSTRARREAEDVARRVEYVELSTRLDFQGLFVEAMSFPAAARSS
ncbi:MAG: ASKHA domain-containing protein [Chloroflexota bacterium]